MVNNRKPSLRKSRKSTKKILKSSFTLNLCFMLFVLNILVFLFFKDIQNLYLLLIGVCITYLFNKNIIIVLILPMLFVAILILLRKLFMKKELIEGIENQENSIVELEKLIDDFKIKKRNLKEKIDNVVKNVDM